MQHQEFQPPEELKDIIKCFWYNKRFTEDLLSGFEVQPDSYAEIIFHFGSALNTSYDGRYQELPSPFIMGLLDRPVIFNSKESLEIIGIRCFPWTVFDLLELEPGKSRVHIFDQPIAQLHSVLSDLIRSADIEQAIEAAKVYFLKAAQRMTASSMLLKAGNAMQEKHGSIPVSQVAAAAHATVRTLERNFKQSSGFSVKDVSGLMRFEQVRNLLSRYPDTKIASLVNKLGYTDRSHLTREFKRYSGTTPAAFARNSKVRQQALSADFDAIIQL